MQTAVTESATAAAPDEQLATRLLYQRIIVLGTEVDDLIANRLCGQLLLLSAEDPRSDISLYINSPGGSVTAGLAIYDTMHLIPNDVRTLAMGLAGSMASSCCAPGRPASATACRTPRSSCTRARPASAAPPPMSRSTPSSSSGPAPC
jgi:ATP-dependent Clp protease, protease subunit